MKTCCKCNAKNVETCPDGYCRDCHVSLSFEDCCDGTWNAKLMLANGHPRAEVLELYPEAKI